MGGPLAIYATEEVDVVAVVVAISFDVPPDESSALLKNSESNKWFILKVNELLYSTPISTSSPIISIEMESPKLWICLARYPLGFLLCSNGHRNHRMEMKENQFADCCLHIKRGYRIRIRQAINRVAVSMIVPLSRDYISRINAGSRA